MIRRAFTMRLQSGKLGEYKHFHDNVWPELVAEIEKSGIASMTIFENDPILFLYSEITDESAWDKLWHTKIYDKWSEEAMNPLMFLRDDGIVDLKHPSGDFPSGDRKLALLDDRSWRKGRRGHWGEPWSWPTRRRARLAVQGASVLLVARSELALVATAASIIEKAGARKR